MDAQKTTKVTVERTAPVQVEVDPGDSVRELKPDQHDNEELTIDEDFDWGGDPYNNTGQHVIIELKRKSSDK